MADLCNPADPADPAPRAIPFQCCVPHQEILLVKMTDFKVKKYITGYMTTVCLLNFLVVVF